MTEAPSPGRSRTRGVRRRTARLGAVLAVGALLLSGCGDAREVYEDALGFGIPDPISNEGENIQELYLGSNAAALVVGTFVFFLIFWAMFRYRKRSDQLPRQVRYNLPIEVLYTVVPFVVIAVLFYYTVLSQNYVNDLTEDDAVAESELLDIGVVGFQWNWQFNYLDEGVQVTGETNRPAQLVLPTDRRVRFTLNSPDVIHSFWLPEWLFKRDVFPERDNVFELEMTKEGEYIGRCAELCGEKHAFMNFSVLVVSPEEYDAYIADLQADPDAAILAGSES